MVNKLTKEKSELLNQIKKERIMNSIILKKKNSKNKTKKDIPLEKFNEVLKL